MGVAIFVVLGMILLMVMGSLIYGMWLGLVLLVKLLARAYTELKPRA